MRQDQEFNRLKWFFHLPHSYVFFSFPWVFIIITNPRTCNTGRSDVPSSNILKSTELQLKPVTKNISRDEPYLLMGLGTVLPHFGSIKDTPFHVASMIFFSQQTAGQRMSLEPNSKLWSIPCRIISTLAASLGTCTRYGGIATGMVMCSDSRTAGRSSCFWVYFLLFTLNQKQANTIEGATPGYKHTLSENLMVHSFS